MIPYVRGVRKYGWRIMGVAINYVHSLNMKLQEEGDPIWVANRLYQLNLLFDLLGKASLRHKKLLRNLYCKIIVEYFCFRIRQPDARKPQP